MYNQNYPGYYPNQGYAYSVARPQPGNSQVLTEEQANALKQNRSMFDMKIDQLTLYKAICTHRDPKSGAMTLTFNSDGTCTCAICGETFRMFDGTAEDVKAAVDTIKDIMQTTKTLYMDAPHTLTENYYQQIALLDKLVGLWKHSVDNFAKYENVNNPLNPISGSYSGFGALNTLLTAPYNMYYGQVMMPQQAPMMSQAPAAGMMPQQAPMTAPAAGIMPQQAPMYGYDPSMVNPMAYGGQPMMSQAPVMTQQAPPAMAQQAPMAATAPAAPAPQNNEVQQQKVYNV